MAKTRIVMAGRAMLKVFLFIAYIVPLALLSEIKIEKL